MKRTQVSIPWPEGLHLRPAASVVKAAKAYKSSIRLRVGSKVADACSILAIMLLSAGAGAMVDVEVSGEDEDLAFKSVLQLFESGVEPGAENTFKK
jgi:phosphotransferase system HPr (HPr) family protein